MKLDLKDREFITTLLKRGGANSQEKQEIFRLYKKYVDPNHLTWTDSSCGSCSSSILKMWNKIKELL